ncbi:MAG TPA: hypothetical protein VG477_17445, partial [Thermoanaerobaculia bacterium]|nr:hypothetical protein [Thermoanaerobaculia bacterium]
MRFRGQVRLSLLEIVLLAGLLAAPLLPPLAAAFAALAVSLAWLWMRSGRERTIAAPFLALAAASLLAAWLFDVQARSSQDEWVAKTRRDYARLWEDLRGEAAAAAAAVGGPAETPQARLKAFSRLEDVKVREGEGRRAVLLL